MDFDSHINLISKHRGYFSEIIEACMMQDKSCLHVPVLMQTSFEHRVVQVMHVHANTVISKYNHFPSYPPCITY